MASSGTLSPCTSPAMAARLSSHSCSSPVRLALPPNVASRHQKQHTPARRRLHVSLAALVPAAAPAACCSPSSSNFNSSPAHGCSPLQPGLQQAWPAAYAHRPLGSCRLLRSGSCVCRNAAAGGPSGPTNGSNADRDGLDANTDAAAATGLPRATSPVTTAQQPLAAYEASPPGSHGTSSSTLSLDPHQDTASSAEPQAALLSPAAAAAVTLPAAAASSASRVFDASTAAAAAEAAVAGALDGRSNMGAAGVATPSEGPSAAVGELQDLFTMLGMQVAAQASSVQLISTLVPIVRCATASQLTLPFVMAAGRHTLLLRLLDSEDPAVAVLAAEIWCRVCGEADLDSWQQDLMPAVPVLLHIIASHATPEGRKVPLLFFAVSSLVRMATLPAVARAVQQQGGLAMLVEALHVVPAAICQVTTFALFRLMRELDGDMTDEQLSSWQQKLWKPSTGACCSSSGHVGAAAQQEHEQGQELALLTYVRAGAFSKLCQVLAHVEEGSAHELAFSMLLSLALIPSAQQLVADQGEVKYLVQVMAKPPSRAVRLQAMLVLGRLAARNRACQQDAVREGVVPVLVKMMMQGSEEERCHSCRLLAILGQHETTHQTIMDSDALPAMLQMLRNQGTILTAGAAHSISVMDPDMQPWQDSVPDTATLDSRPAIDAGYEHEAEQDEVEVDGGSAASSSTYRTSGPFKAAKRPASPGTAAAAAAAGSKTVGPDLVLEQAAGLACMLCHNADNHFLLVNQGVVPLLVMQLQPGTSPKTVTYTLASLLMLCMADSRSAAVVARAGAIPGLVSIVRESSHRPANRELAAAMLAVMCWSQAAQVDVVASGGIPALTRLLAEGTTSGCCSAAEALAQIAATSDVRCRLIVRAGALPHLTPMLQANSNPNSLLWAARLLRSLAQERNTLWEVCETPGLLALLPGILNRRPQQQQLQRLILEFHSTASAAAAAADVSAGVAENAQGVQAEAGLPTYDTEELDLDAAATASDDGTLEKAQAHVAWLLAALASDPRTRYTMAELASYLVRPLVTMLRPSQESSGPGYTLHDVLHGMANNRQAAASSALRALSQHVRIAGLVSSEIALQHWMGHNVQLPKTLGEWPPATPGWFLDVDWWSPDGAGDDDKASWA